MFHRSTFRILACFFLAACAPGARARTPQYDVIIVGGGLAGLTAAYELNELKTLLLEKEGVLGGRVATAVTAGVTVDVGALFAYPVEAIPFSFEGSPLMREEGPVGLALAGRSYFGRGVSEIAVAAGVLPAADLPWLPQQPDRWTADPELYPVLNAFFQAVYPGEMNRSIIPRQRDALKTLTFEHRAATNRELIDAFASRLRGDIMTRSEVLTVSEEAQFARVTYRRGGKTETATARAVIVTVPPRAARRIISAPRPEAARFLSNAEFAGGAVLALVVAGPRPKNFRYLVSPTTPMNAVFAAPATLPGRTVYTLLFAGIRWIDLQKQPDEELVSAATRSMRALGLLAPVNTVAGSVVRRWPEIGPMISAKTYAGFTTEATRAGARIFLAGDYTSWTAELMPYGMRAAVDSGRLAAGRARVLATE